MSDSKNIYMMGICGTGMGALAGLLKKLGNNVTGSDENVYPPMSDKLQEWGIPVLEGYKSEHLEGHEGLVVVGNVIRKVNPEATRARELGLEMISMAEALSKYAIADKHSIVVAGTHGKTSITAIMAHILMEAGSNPGYLVGGALLGYPDSFRVGDGKFFAIEGDEYDTAYFDKGPKFLHYKPQTAIITSLEFDHADIFDSIDDVERAFQKLIQIMPKNGHLVIWRGAERAVRLARESDFEGKLTIYDSEPGPGVDLWLSDISTGAQGVSFNATYHNESLGHFELPQWGDYSALNGAAILGALIGAGLSPDEVRGPMSTFRGVKRRMEIRGEFDGVTLVDDFGHHPTAIKVTLDGARARFGERRIIAVFEPRSATTRRSVFQKELVDAFLVADRAIIGSHERLGEIDEAERFSPERLVRDLNERGVEAAHIPEVGEIVETLAKTVQSGDVIMVFSNGAFGGLHQKLEAKLTSVQEENK